MKDSVPDDAALREELCAFDSETLDARAARLRRVYELLGPAGQSYLLYGGAPALYALFELERAFVSRLYVATVLLAQTFIEHSIAAAFDLGGDPAAAASGLHRLVDRAEKEGLVSRQLAEAIQDLRRARNPYAHYRTADHAGSHTKRVLSLRDNQLDVETVLRDDAEHALRVVRFYLDESNARRNRVTR